MSDATRRSLWADPGPGDRDVLTYAPRTRQGAESVPPIAAPTSPPPSPAAPAPIRRSIPAPRRGIADALILLAGLGLGIVILLGVTAESAGSLHAAGGLVTAAGRMAGLIAAYGMVVAVLLVARIPGLERAVGQDRLVGWHRKLGPWPLYLVAAHGTLITIGYARAAHDGLLHQLGQLVWTYPGILASTAGFVLLIAAGVTSYRKARRRLAYETWWSVHLYTYLALFLAFSHQVDTGASFVGHPAATTFWKTLFYGTLATVVLCRVVLPLARSARHRLEVVGVVPAGPGAYSVLVKGRNLHRLPIAGGQFLQWRFLQPGSWWQAHPYSLSAAPRGNHLRITVKDLGDHSAALRTIAPGTRIAFEGPYGAFTAHHRVTDRLLVVGAGVGTTPILALLQELPDGVAVDAILRARSADQIAHRDELWHEVRRRGGTVHEVLGPRDGVRLDATTLSARIPDIAQRDVYVCGPPAVMRAVLDAARVAGVPEPQLHHEAFI